MKTILNCLCATALVLGTSAALAQGGGLPSADKADPAMKIATPDFARTAMSSDMFEIRSSEMAEEKAKTGEVKSFAKQMIADHRKAEKDLKTALGDKAKSGAMMAPKHAAMLKQLEAAKDAEFETLYVAMQAKGHMEAVALFRTYSGNGNGDDAKVKAFAKETLPTLEMHMEHVQQLVADM